MPKDAPSKTAATLSESNGISPLLARHLRRTPILSKEAQRALVRKFQNGDRRALEVLTQSNLRFIIGIALRFQGRGLDINELIAEGSMGLRMAALRFDLSRPYVFMTYAVWWIRTYIGRAVHQTGRLVSLSTDHEQQIQNLGNKGKIRWRQVIGGDSVPEINDPKAETSRHLFTAILSSQRPLSLDAPIGEFDGETPRMVNLAAEDQDLPESEARDELVPILQRLGWEDREILERRFGLGGRPIEGLREIGEWLGVSKERARQRIGAAIALLRRSALTFQHAGA